MWIRLKRRLRTLLGMGWSPEEFRCRYRQGKSDSWGYFGDAGHQVRAERILAAFPDWPITNVLELGCAEGFLTEQLLARGISVTACDLSDEAVRRARERCHAYSHVTLVVQDIRRNLPRGQFDVCLLSDVLYYLSPSEIRKLSEDLAEVMNPRRRLVFANEWNPSYRDLTPPKKAVESLVQAGRWKCVTHDNHVFENGSMHFVAVIE